MDTIEKGYIGGEKIKDKESLRKETSEQAQRPAPLKNETVKGEGGRGSFKDKC